MIRDPEHEKMSRKELEQLQLERLQAKVHEVYAKVPFYHRAFEARQISPDDIKTLSDLTRLPFTTKLDFRDNYPYELLAVPLEQIVRIHASSGTTGKPIVAAYTQGDIDTWSEILARALATAGVTKQDILQNALGYGLFTGGLGFHYGAERLGAAVVPSATGNTKRQITLLQDLGTTVLACTPSYALVISETALEMEVNLRNTNLRLALCGAEPWSEQMRKDIEEKLGVPAIDNYGLTEVIGPGVSMECRYQCGMHIPEDHFLVEIINPETGEQLPYGKEGELVITTLTKEACPVLRFRTRDITSLNPEPCRCGRTQVRMSRVTGRTDDMLVVRGVNVFPSQIESVLLEVEGVLPHYQIVVDRQHAFSYTDLEVWVEVSEDIFSDEMQKMESLANRIRSNLDSVLGISTRVKLVEPKTIARGEGKAKRVVDRSEL
ncbi:MAG: phenylacetate--CoA ligase [Chloroflexota bacterium]